MKREVLSVLSSAAWATASVLDIQATALIRRVGESGLARCALTQLFMLRWDTFGEVSAYGLANQRHCLKSTTNVSSRNMNWTQRVVARVQEASATYADTKQTLPTSRRLAEMAGLWWQDDYLATINTLLEGQNVSSCDARIFVFTGNISQSCQVLVPALFEFDTTQDSVYLLRRSQHLSEPWENRISKIYYRGTDSPPESCSQFLPPSYNPQRGLERLSEKYPNLIDASLKRNVKRISDFARYRYLVDIGGTSCTTWSSLHWKLATGSLVFVVTLPGGLSTWWMRNELRPHEHYVPIEPDFADLLTKLEYFENHTGEATAIAARGQRAALQYTQGRVYDVLGRILSDSLGDSSAPLMPYSTPINSTLWYCAVGRAQSCDIQIGRYGSRKLKSFAPLHMISRSYKAYEYLSR